MSEHGLQPGPALHPEHAQVGVGGGGRHPGTRWAGFRGHHVSSLCFCCSLATDFLPTFMYCMSSGNFDVVQTALRNLPEYVLLCQGEATPPPALDPSEVRLLQPKLTHLSPTSPPTEHADILLHKAFIVGIYGQIDTSSVIAESMKVLHMEAI